MSKVKITILKTDFNTELAQRYGAETLSGACPLFTEGQTLFCDQHNPPKHFCGEAWKCIQHYVYALYYGAEKPFGKDWMRAGNVAIACCNDGLRPVTFKIECVDDNDL